MSALAPYHEALLDDLATFFTTGSDSTGAEPDLYAFYLVLEAGGKQWDIGGQ